MSARCDWLGTPACACAFWVAPWVVSQCGAVRSLQVQNARGNLFFFALPTSTTGTSTNTHQAYSISEQVCVRRSAHQYPFTPSPCPFHQSKLATTPRFQRILRAQPPVPLAATTTTTTTTTTVGLTPTAVSQDQLARPTVATPPLHQHPRISPRSQLPPPAR